jgi:hypothetical protein
MIRLISWSAMALVFGSIVGCGGGEKILRRPSAETTWSTFVGTPLSGPVAVPTTTPSTTAPSGDRLLVSIQPIWLKVEPSTSLLPVATRGRLSTRQGADVPLTPTADLAARARLGLGDEADAVLKSIEAGTPDTTLVDPAQEIALAAGQTVEWTLAVDRGGDGERIISLRIGRESGSSSLQWSLRLKDSIVAQVENETLSAKAFELRTLNRHEQIELDPISIAEANHVALLVATPTARTRADRRPAQAVALRLFVREPSADQDIAAAVDRSNTAVTSPFRPARIDAVAAALESALVAAVDPARRRQAMSFVATSGRADIAADLMLVADDAWLTDFADALRAARASSTQTWNADTLGWAMDRVALNRVAHAAASGKLTGELRGVLLVHAGVAGRNPSGLDELARLSTGRADFVARVQAENMIGLEDSSPATRVRAFDWLMQNNTPLAGYDPLGSPRDRAAAIESALNNTTTQPTNKP